MVKETIFLLAFCFSFSAGSAQSAGSKKLSATQAFAIDTVLKNVRIEGRDFLLTVLRDTLDRERTQPKPEFSQLPVVVRITQEQAGQLFLEKRFSFNDTAYAPFLNYTFFKPNDASLDNEAKLFLTVNKSYGGSGSEDNTYHIGLESGQMFCRHLFKSSGELDFLVFKNDIEFTLLQGIWAKGESHYENHRYTLRTFTFEAGQWLERGGVKTKKKYPTLDISQKSCELLRLIRQSEPDIFRPTGKLAEHEN